MYPSFPIHFVSNEVGQQKNLSICSCFSPLCQILEAIVDNQCNSVATPALLYTAGVKNKALPAVDFISPHTCSRPSGASLRGSRSRVAATVRQIIVRMGD